MRELKFRAWDPHNKCFLHRFMDNFMLCVLEKGGSLGYIIEQYTGLKDKNGTEIWESDIVRHTSQNPRYKTTFFVVQYRPGAWIQWPIAKDKQWEENRDPYECVEWDWYNVEVVGNIHENPELVESE